MRVISNQIKLAIGWVIPRYPSKATSGYIPGLRTTLRDVRRAASTPGDIKIELDLSPAQTSRDGWSRLGLRIGEVVLADDIHQPLAEEMLFNLQSELNISSETTPREVRRRIFHAPEIAERISPEPIERLRRYVELIQEKFALKIALREHKGIRTFFNAVILINVASVLLLGAVTPINLSIAVTIALISLYKAAGIVFGIRKRATQILKTEELLFSKAGSDLARDRLAAILSGIIRPESKAN